MGIPMKQPAVYIMASRRKGTLYTGVTGDLIKRVWEHKNDLVEGFTKRYGVHSLVYVEVHQDIGEAIRREKQIKKWNRAWKIALIEKGNREWQDLWPTLVGGDVDSRFRGNDCDEGTLCDAQISAVVDSRFRGNDGNKNLNDDKKSKTDSEGGRP
jgi:putative endonuclease